MATANTTTIPSDNAQRKAIDILTVSDEDEADPAFPHFLVVESTTYEPIKHSTFALQKILQCAVGTVKNAKKLRNGKVVIEVLTKAQAVSAMSMQTWIDVAVKVTPRRSLYVSRGVIRCRDFRGPQR
jgi:hypothetical protein